MAMKRMIRMLAPTVACLTVLVFAPVAHAATTLVVDDDGQAAPGNCADPTATFSSIGDAVAAASAGDTVQVCPGSYTENVVVDKQLFLEGAKAGIDARTRSLSNESIVESADPSKPIFLLDADGVVLDGFLVQDNTGNAGVQTTQAHSGYQVINDVIRNNVFGLYLQSGGATQTVVQHDRFVNNNQSGSANGNGIYSDAGLQSALIAQNRFVHHANAAITLVGQGTACSTCGVVGGVTIERNTSSNDATFVALFGVQNSDVFRNTTNDTVNSDDANQGSAVFIGGGSTGILVQANRLRNPAFSGIAVRDVLGTAGNAVRILSNTILNAVNNGIDVTTATAAATLARNNTTKFNDVDGIFFGPDTNGNSIRSNTSLSNGSLDCHDESVGGNTAGTANIWASNTGVTDDPNGLCTPPA
jgi:hypothetical protein